MDAAVYQLKGLRGTKVKSKSAHGSFFAGYRKWTRAEHELLIELAEKHEPVFCPVCSFEVTARTFARHIYILHCGTCGNHGGQVSKPGEDRNSVKSDSGVWMAVAD